MKIFKELLSYLIIIVVVIMIRTFIFSPGIVSGPSMETTLFDKNIVIINKMFKNISRFDIVVIKEEKDYIIKRVVGLPGEKIEYYNNKLFINDKEIKNLDFEITNNFSYEKIEENKYFVLGDNRDISKDSRYIGTIDNKKIIGKVNFILFPFKKFGGIE